MLKKQNGITLIALVITIIVMLILAGVSINLAFGNNGVIKKANSAQHNTDITKEREIIGIALSAIKMAKIEESENSENFITAQELEDEINNIYGEEKVEVSGEDPLIITYKKSGNVYEVGQHGEVNSLIGDELIFANAKKHPEQVNSETIAVTEDGEAVNMDLWSFEKNGSNAYSIGLYDHGYGFPGYTNEDIVNGEIQGEIPKYIKEENGEFYPVTGLEQTFNGCTNLKKAPKIPSTVTNLNFAFAGCTSLEEAPIIPVGVTEMYGTFSGCEKLKKAPKLPENLVNIERAFEDCILLEEAPEIPESVTSVWCAFAGCKSLKTTPYLPDEITDLSRTFENCTSLTKITNVPSGVTFFSESFKGCTSLIETPKFSDSVTALWHAFEGCTNLTKVSNFPSNVTNLDGVFMGCTSLKEVPQIPNTVETMQNMFNGCTSLEIAPKLPNSTNTLWGTFKGCTSLNVAPEIPSSVTICVSAFEGCTNLTTAPVIPSTVRNLNRTFYGCSKLTGILEINATNSYNTDTLYDAATASESNLVLTGSSPNLAEILASKSENSKISLGN